MRKFKFQRDQAVIRTLKEPKPPKRFNWDRLLFIGMLSVAAFFLLRHLYSGLAQINGDGQVMYQSLPVQFTDDIRVRGLKVNEGDTVTVGDTLFVYNNQLYDDDGAEYFRVSDKRSWLDKELLNIDRELTRVKANLIRNKEMQRHLESELVRLNNYVIIELASYDQIADAKAKLVGYESEERYLYQQLSFLRNERYRLVDRRGNIVDPVSGSFNSQRLLTSFISPVDGVIGRIDKHENEVCYARDKVMLIHQDQDIYIEAYFDQKFFASIREGQEVKITFEDDETVHGLIDRINVSTIELPPEFQKTYEPTERRIMTRIVPVSEADYETWKRHYKMNVRVSMPRFSGI